MSRSSRRTFPVSRRDFLRAMGVGAAAPFIPVLDQHAEAAGFPQRLVIIHIPIGMVTPHDLRPTDIPEPFWPSGGETDFYFPSGSVLEPLSAYKNYMVIPKGIQRIMNSLIPNYDGGHENALSGLLTGCDLDPNSGQTLNIALASGASIDQIIANTVPQGTSFPTMEVGVQWDVKDQNPGPACFYLSYDGPAQPRARQGSPYKIFDKLAATIPVDNTAALEKIRVKKQSVLDLHKAELTSLKNKISASDRTKLDAHLTAITSLEKDLQPQAPTMQGCVLSPVGGNLDVNANDNFPAITKMQMDLIVQALACDRTRIATLQLSNSYSGTVHSWVGAPYGHHGVTHTDTDEGKGWEMNINRWFSQQVAYFLGQLKGRAEGGGNLLDNTLVVVVPDSASANGHLAGPSNPVYMAGKFGGRVQTGRFIDYGGAYGWNQFLLTLCRAMGANVSTVGNLANEYQTRFGHNPSASIPGLIS